MELVIVLVIWLLLCGLCGSIARGKGHSSFGAFFVGLIFSPLIGLIYAAALSDRRVAATVAAVAAAAAAPAAAASDTRPCPRCAEAIKRAAVVCRFCNSAVEPLDPPARR